MTDISEVKVIEADDKVGFEEKAAALLSKLTTIDPKKLHCLMVCAVTNDSDGRVMVSALGSDQDIAKMMMTLSEVTSQGIVKANLPSNPNKETAH